MFYFSSTFQVKLAAQHFEFDWKAHNGVSPDDLCSNTTCSLKAQVGSPDSRNGVFPQSLEDVGQTWMSFLTRRFLGRKTRRMCISTRCLLWRVSLRKVRPILSESVHPGAYYCHFDEHAWNDLGQDSNSGAGDRPTHIDVHFSFAFVALFLSF